MIELTWYLLLLLPSRLHQVLLYYQYYKYSVVDTATSFKQQQSAISRAAIEFSRQQQLHSVHFQFLPVWSAHARRQDGTFPFSVLDLFWYWTDI